MTDAHMLGAWIRTLLTLAAIVWVAVTMAYSHFRRASKTAAPVGEGQGVTVSINGIVCYAPDPCECPDCTIAGLRAALQRIARGDYCAETCTAYLTAMAALGCPHTPPCPGCTGVVAQDSKPLRPRPDVTTEPKGVKDR